MKNKDKTISLRLSNIECCFIRLVSLQYAFRRRKSVICEKVLAWACDTVLTAETSKLDIC